MGTASDWRDFAPKAKILAHIVARRTEGCPAGQSRDDYYAMLLEKAWEAWKATGHLELQDRTHYTKRALENLAWDMTRRAQAQARSPVAWGLLDQLPDPPGGDLEAQYSASEVLRILVARLSPEEMQLLLVAAQWRAADREGPLTCQERKARAAARARAREILGTETEVLRYRSYGGGHGPSDPGEAGPRAWTALEPGNHRGRAGGPHSEG